MKSPKELEEFKARRAQQAVEGVQAMAEYRKAEDAALARMAQLRGEREARLVVAPPQAKTKKRKAKHASASHAPAE